MRKTFISRVSHKKYLHDVEKTFKRIDKKERLEHPKRIIVTKSPKDKITKIERIIYVIIGIATVIAIAIVAGTILYFVR